MGLPRPTGRSQQPLKHPFLAAGTTPKAGHRRHQAGAGLAGIISSGASHCARHPSAPGRADTHVGPFPELMGAEHSGKGSEP